jgi:predicted outer membrane lipoprotein
MRSPQFTVALLIALAITALWWQLAEKRARKAEASVQVARQHEQEANRRIGALNDSIRTLREALLRRGPEPAANPR